jgi:hypothetical protein
MLLQIYQINSRDINGFDGPNGDGLKTRPANKIDFCLLKVHAWVFFFSNLIENFDQYYPFSPFSDNHILENSYEILAKLFSIV